MVLFALALFVKCTLQPHGMSGVIFTHTPFVYWYQDAETGEDVVVHAVTERMRDSIFISDDELSAGLPRYPAQLDGTVLRWLENGEAHALPEMGRFASGTSWLVQGPPNAHCNAL